MKKTLTTAALCATTFLLPVMATAGTSTEEEILQKLEYLTSKVMAQQEHIDALEGKLGNEDTGAKKESGAIVLANSAIDQLKGFLNNYNNKNTIIGQLSC